MASDLRTVRLLGTPRAALSDARVYIGDVIRELQLIELGFAQGLESPTRLRQIAAELLPTLKWARDVMTRAHAVSAGPDHVDLTVRLPSDADDDVVRLLGLLAELQFFARQGELFAEIDPGIQALFDWFASESVAQIGGQEPTRFDRRR